MDGYLNLLKGQNRSTIMGLSLVLIMAFHLSLYGNLLRFPAFDFLFGKGYLGVDVFFLLSTYGLCHSLKKNSIKEFYARRAKRLYPLYFFFLTILLIAFPDSRGDSWIKTFIFQSTGISTFTKMEIEWFIPALIIVYALFPIFFKGIEWVYNKGVAASAALVTILAIGCPFLEKWALYLFILRLPVITLGVITFLALERRDLKQLLIPYIFCAFVGLMYIGNSRLNVSMTGSLVIPLLLFGIGQLPVSGFRFRVLPFIGEHSLEIYLAQCIAFNHFMASSTFDFPLSVLISLTIIPVIACFLYYAHSIIYKLFEHARKQAG